MAYSELHPAAIGSVISYLEMREPPTAKARASSPWKLARLERPDVETYRRLFRKVGQNWLWFERLMIPADELREIIEHPAVEVYVVVDRRGTGAGMLELDFRAAGQCTIAYVGLLAEHTGKGHGRWLLQEALRLAWREGVSLVKLNTCTLDHPAALKAYLRAGFRVVSRAIGTFFDPRLRGLLPRDAAPQIPIVESEAQVPKPADPSPGHVDESPGSR
jgi:GNAT superfamily N-acetyltransferase